jgi:cell division protein FtsB
MTKHPIRIALAGAALAGGATLAAPSIASATKPVAPGANFTAAQQKVEQQLAARVKELQELSSDVTNAKSLTPADASTLAARLAAATQSIGALVTEVPSDTTFAELATARRTMIQGNRVFAVLMPQVFEVIEADTAAAQVTTMQAGEAALQGEVSALSGEVGYGAASNHYKAYVAEVTRAATATSRVSTTVMAQVASDFPHDIHVFVNANRQLLDANIALAHASYDASLVGLASGGYSGS